MFFIFVNVRREESDVPGDKEECDDDCGGEMELVMLEILARESCACSRDKPSAAEERPESRDKLSVLYLASWS